jgi:anti-sigma regulatory factor (Ser/Thr protein kinase)
VSSEGDSSEPAGAPEHEALAGLRRLTDQALDHLPQEELLAELLERASRILDTDTAAILLLEPGARRLRARAARGIEEEVERGVVIPVGKGFAGRVAAERRAIVIDDVDHADIINPILREKGIRSLLGVPLLVGDRVLGVLHVGSLRSRRFTPEECELLQLAADRAALAIEQASLYEQRYLAETLQQQLLPDLGSVPGVELASSYLPASLKTLGGDWYDAFPLPGGRTAVAVGDVVGHGVAAAAAMAQLRTTLRAYAVDGHPLAEVVGRMNRLMWQLGPRAMTTLSFVVLDAEAGTLEHVSAGHPPPLAVGADGSSAYLPVSSNMPLAAAPETRFQSTVHPYAVGTTILLYTDGLVERRGESIDTGLERLRAVASGAAGVQDMCDRVAARLVPEQRADDVAMIAVRVPSPPAVLSKRWPAERRILVEIRQELRRWLRARGADDDEAYDITVACQEACANAAEHAYGPGPRSFLLEAACDAGGVRLTVRDEGRWRAPRGEHRGRGIALMRMLMDDVEVESGEQGTRVVLRRALGRGCTP